MPDTRLRYYRRAATQFQLEAARAQYPALATQLRKLAALYEGLAAQLDASQGNDRRADAAAAPLPGETGREWR
jgi:hypothetical protein